MTTRKPMPINWIKMPETRENSKRKQTAEMVPSNFLTFDRCWSMRTRSSQHWWTCLISWWWAKRRPRCSSTQGKWIQSQDNHLKRHHSQHLSIDRDSISALLKSKHFCKKQLTSLRMSTLCRRPTNNQEIEWLRSRHKSPKIGKASASSWLWGSTTRSAASQRMSIWALQLPRQRPRCHHSRKRIFSWSTWITSIPKTAIMLQKCLQSSLKKPIFSLLKFSWWKKSSSGWLTRRYSSTFILSWVL